jgi:hypothetical protein
MINRLLYIKRINIIGLALGVIGLSVVITPPSATLSIINFIWNSYGIHPAIIGGLMSAGGWIILMRDTRLSVFVLCTLPWIFYSVATFFFLWRQELAATVGLAYLLISALIYREALERPL